VTRFLLALLLDFLPRALASVLVVLPFVSAVAGSGIGAFPEGDRLLFEAGGLVLSEVARALLPAAGSLLSASFTLFVALAVLLLIPHAAVLVLLAEARRPAPVVLWGRALASIPALLFVTGVALFAQVLTLTFASMIAGALRRSLANELPWVADGAFLAVLALALLLALAVGVARDLGRAAAIQAACDGRAAAFAGLATLRSRPAAALGAFATSLFGAILLAVFAALLTTEADVSRAGDYRFALVVLIHQGAAAGVSAFRVRWFETALELTRPQ
jgi:hypothetical protein